jgi:hypothetical protein
LLQRSRTREKIRVTTAGLTRLVRWSNITRVGSAVLAKTATQTGKQIRLARLPRIAQTAARIDEKIRLAGLTGLAGLATRSIEKEVPVVLLTRKSGLWRIQPTRKVGLQKIQLTCKSWATENSANTESRVMKNSGKPGYTGLEGQEAGRRKMCCSKQKANSMVVPKGYYQDTKMQIIKDASKRVGREKIRARVGLLV